MKHVEELIQIWLKADETSPIETVDVVNTKGITVHFILRLYGGNHRIKRWINGKCSTEDFVIHHRILSCVLYILERSHILSNRPKMDGSRHLSIHISFIEGKERQEMQIFWEFIEVWRGSGTLRFSNFYVPDKCCKFK
jgi:hypothetical protein